MPTIVDFPTIVKEAVDVFGDLFANEPARRHFAEYLTGLMVAEKKTVSGINSAFVVTTDQSCLNRWLNEVTWDVKALNDRRLVWLQGDPKTRYSPRGVIAIDNTLVDHAGKLIEDLGWFWDHANERYIIAHDYMISNYVCPSGAHYPIEWRRFKKKDACKKGEFTDHTELCIELINDAIAHGIPGDFTVLARAAEILLAVAPPEDTDIFKPTASRLAHMAVIDVVATGVAMRRGPAALESLRRIKYTLSQIPTLDEPAGAAMRPPPRPPAAARRPAPGKSHA